MAIFVKSSEEIILETNPDYGFGGDFLYNQVALYKVFFQYTYHKLFMSLVNTVIIKNTEV